MNTSSASSDDIWSRSDDKNFVKPTKGNTKLVGVSNKIHPIRLDCQAKQAKPRHMCKIVHIVYMQIVYVIMYKHYKVQNVALNGSSLAQALCPTRRTFWIKQF